MASGLLSVARLLGAGALLALGGCALPPPTPGGVVHVADIINSVKCGLAQALLSEAGRRRLPGTYASVELQLKVVDTRSFGGSSPTITAAAPFILAWYGPIALPTISGSNAQSYTVDTVINLTYRLDGPNISACNAVNINAQDKFGFARWLGDVIAGLSAVSLDGPKGSLDKLTYDAAFAVTREGTVGGTVRVVFIDAGANTSRSRSDTQRLKIVITGPNGIAGSQEGPTNVRGLTNRQIGPVPNLSSSPAAPSN